MSSYGSNKQYAIIAIDYLVQKIRQAILLSTYVKFIYIYYHPPSMCMCISKSTVQVANRVCRLVVIAGLLQ